MTNTPLLMGLIKAPTYDWFFGLVKNPTKPIEAKFSSPFTSTKTQTTKIPTNLKLMARTISSYHPKKKRVCKKKFGFPVGIDGFSRAFCFSVVVIYDIRDNRIITAFPSL